MAESKDLLQVLWSGADVLRGKMDANEYKTYLLGLIFYKYLSDSYLAKVYDLLNDETPDDLQEAQKQYEEVMKTEDAKDLPSRFWCVPTWACMPSPPWASSTMPKRWWSATFLTTATSLWP